ncbi:MAG: porin [Pseudomonadota bacterium]
MKHLSLTAAAAAALALFSSGSVLAQTGSTVTIYGIADAGLNRVTGLKNGTYTGLASGIMEGSRFGLKGTEDVGNGYKTIFTLENRFEIDTGSVSNTPPSSPNVLPDRFTTATGLGLTGTALAVSGAVLPGLNSTLGGSIGVNVGAGANRLFDRQAFVGMITPFGQITAGRQYTPAYLLGAAFDASQTQSSLAVGQVASIPPAFDIRLSNTLQYAIQMSGVTAAIMYGAGEVAGSNSNSNGRFWGAFAMYKGPGFSAGFGRNQRNNELGQKSLENNVLGASVDVGPGAIYAQYATIKDENPSGISTIGSLVGTNATLVGLLGAPGAAAVGASYQAAYNNAFRQDAKLMHIGYKMTMGPHTIVTAYNRLDDKRPSNADTSSYGVTYTYALSKRTNLNAVLTRFNNNANGQAAPGGNGFLGGVTAAPGTDSTNMAFGIRHAF